MKTIIMTVGTSLRTNPDRDLPDDKKRPWVKNKHRYDNQCIFHDTSEPLAWMQSSELEIISAETNTLWRLDPAPSDRILLLHSATFSGQECAEVLQAYFHQHLEQPYVTIEPIPDIDYDLDEYAPPLERMANLLRQRIQQAQHGGSLVTLAATGGFKAQTMVMGLVGNALGVPVCYVHEAYKTLIYLPYIDTSGQPERKRSPANLPESGRSRDSVIQVQADTQGHHRPKSWKKVEKMLKDLPWVDLVRYDSQAFSAPKNGVKGSPRDLDDGRKALWLNLYESDKYRMAVTIETTGHTPEHKRMAADELRERLGRIF